MTVKVLLNVDPIHNVAHLIIQQERKNDQGAFEIQSRQEIQSPVPVQSQVFELQEGDKLLVAFEPGKKIVYDIAQGSAHVEQPPADLEAPPGEEIPPGVEEQTKVRGYGDTHHRATAAKKEK